MSIGGRWPGAWWGRRAGPAQVGPALRVRAEVDGARVRHTALRAISHDGTSLPKLPKARIVCLVEPSVQCPDWLPRAAGRRRSLPGQEPGGPDRSRRSCPRCAAAARSARSCAVARCCLCGSCLGTAQMRRGSCSGTSGRTSTTMPESTSPHRGCEIASHLFGRGRNDQSPTRTARKPHHRQPFFGAAVLVPASLVSTSPQLRSRFRRTTRSCRPTPYMTKSASCVRRTGPISNRAGFSDRQS